MADRIVGNLFSVMWRRKANSPTQRGEYEAPDLGQLLKILNRAENVSSASCEEIVVHLHKGKETLEVYVHDSSSNVTKFDFTKHLPDPDALHAPTKPLNKRQKRQQARLLEQQKQEERKQQRILDGAAQVLTPTLTREQKPHIRLPTGTTEPVIPSHSAAQGLYRAYKA